MKNLTYVVYYVVGEKKYMGICAKRHDINLIKSQFSLSPTLTTELTTASDALKSRWILYMRFIWLVDAFEENFK